MPVLDLAKYLLSCGNDYVIFEWFLTNPLEKCFSKLRQGSRGMYFITSLYVIEKLHIQGAKLSLQLKMEIDGMMVIIVIFVIVVLMKTSKRL